MGEAATQCEALRDVAPDLDEVRAEYTAACSTVRQDDSSRIVTENIAERSEPDGGTAIARAEAAPTTADDALHLAIKLAVDAGDYDRAALLVDVAKRTKSTVASVTSLVPLRDRGLR